MSLLGESNHSRSALTLSLTFSVPHLHAYKRVTAGSKPRTPFSPWLIFLCRSLKAFTNRLTHTMLLPPHRWNAEHDQGLIWSEKPWITAHQRKGNQVFRGPHHRPFSITWIKQTTKAFGSFSLVQKTVNSTRSSVKYHDRCHSSRFSFHPCTSYVLITLNMGYIAKQSW